jgi:molybdopterin molybdotransferase
LKKILNEFPFVVLSGGVSMGKFDFIPSVLADLKVKKVFHKVTQRPGKPFWFGSGSKQQMVFGLPGNPVSCLVNLRRYVLPALFKNIGLEFKNSYAVLEKDISFKKSLTYFPAVSTYFSKEGVQLASPIKSNGSGDYFSLHKSDGILELPSEKELFKKGEAYPFYRWGSWEK